MANIYVIGHKNPDTDSIASACAYAELQTFLDPQNSYIASRCGNLNKQTKYILERTGVATPKLIRDVYPKISDIMTSTVKYVYQDDPVLQALKLVQEDGMLVLPVVDRDKKLKGMIGAHELLRLFIQEQVDERPQYTFDATHIATAIKGDIVHSGESTTFEAVIMVGVMSAPEVQARIDRVGAKRTLLIIGNRTDVISTAIESGVAGVIVTGVESAGELLFTVSGYDGWIYRSKLDTAETVRRAILASPIKTIATEDIDYLLKGDYLDQLGERLLDTKFRALPVVDGEALVGIVTRSNLLYKHKAKLVLVDHNEMEQAVDGVESAEIVAIVDHHRLGSIKTATPVTFYAKPVGSTCTLVHQLYKNAGIKPRKEIAKLLMGGILSDTVMLKSPTSTIEDRQALDELEVLAEVSAKEFGMDIFSSTDSLSTMDIKEVVNTDFKRYQENGLTFGVAQVEVVTLEGLSDVQGELLKELESKKTRDNLNWALLLITDIIKEESVLLSTSYKPAQKLLSYRMIDDNSYSLPGVLSRKKQLIPEVVRVIEELA